MSCALKKRLKAAESALSARSSLASCPIAREVVAVVLAAGGDSAAAADVLADRLDAGGSVAELPGLRDDDRRPAAAIARATAKALRSI